MNILRYCHKCKALQHIATGEWPHPCPTCDSATSRVPQLHLGPHLHVDVTLSLCTNGEGDLFILVQKPSGQDRFDLNKQDVYAGSLSLFD